MVAQFAKIERNPLLFPASNPISEGLGGLADSGSKRADWEIAQPQIGEPALLPDPEQRPVERQPDRVIALSDRDADAFTEIAVVGVGAAAKGTAILGIRAVEPEGERDGVAEQEIDLAAPQCGARSVRVRIRAQLNLGKQSLKISLVRSTGDDGDFLAFKPLRQRILDGGIALRHEARRRTIIGIGEIDP